MAKVHPSAALEQLVAVCKVRARDGDAAAARNLLSEAAGTLRPGARDTEAAHLLAATAVITAQFDLAQRLIEQFLEPELALTIGVEETPKHETPTVKWSLTTNGRSSFQLNPYLFRAHNAALYVNRWIRTLKLVHAYVRSPCCEPGTVDLSLEDHGTLPGLSYCDNRINCFLIPDPYFIRSRGYSAVRRHFRTHDIPWARRLARAFWRGSSSGHPESRELGWRSLPRVKLCELGRQNPESIDALITQIGQMPNAESAAELAASGLTGPHSQVTEINRYRYQIDIDGNTNSWPGLFQKLLTGSPVLKVASPSGYQQWYYDKLKPWINCVPVLVDLSDLIEKIQWLVAHDAEAVEIGRRGRALAMSLDYKVELNRSASTVASAFRYYGGLPEQDIRFGVGRPANACLVRGWSAPEDDGVPALGWESAIELPRPVWCGDLDLELDVAPVVSASSPALTIAVTGELVQRVSVAARQTVQCRISARLLSSDKPIAMTLLHANAVPMASKESPLDNRVASIRIHGLAVRRVDAKGALPTVSAALPAMAAATSRQSAIMQAVHGEDIWRGFLPSGPGTPTIHGWNGLYPPFKRFLNEAPNKVFIDVGVWKGQSTVFVAEAMREAGMDGCVISVDTFLGSIEHSIGERALFKRNSGRPDLYETFLDNVFYRNLTHLVVPLPQTSLTAAALLRYRRIKAGIAHIDASNTYEDTLADAEAYWPLLDAGGYLIGDDYHESWPGVVKAAQEFSRRVAAELTVIMPKWIIRKPS